MYLSYFGFQDYPFSVTPDPAFLYLSTSHREALGHLLYGAGEHGGFVALTGEVGTGKTTLIRAVVHDDRPELDIALCWNPHLGTNEFVATVCDELGVAYEPDEHATLKTLVDRLNAHLLEAHAANRRTVLIIDEAQNLSRDVLEQLRLLTNLETHKEKLLRVILVGQPELTDLLARYDLRQLAQRITARFYLRPLGFAETKAYIQHRLECAEGPQHLFSTPAVATLLTLTGGVPRLINMVCERALMGAYAHGRTRIGPMTVGKAALETLPRRRWPRLSRWWRFALPTGALALAAIIVALLWLPGIPLSSAASWMHGLGQSSAEAGAADEPRATADDRSESTKGASAADGDNADSAPDESKEADRQATSDSDNGAASDARDNPSAKDDPTDQSSAGKSASASDQTAVSSGSGGEITAAGAGQEKPETQQGIPEGDAGINQLLRLWGVFGSQVRSSCASLHVGDLRCLSDSGDFQTVERYNRPALLVLKRDEGKQTVLLSAVEDNVLTLVGSEGTRKISRDRLLSLWTGQFQIVWRSDASVGLIQPGGVGDAVVWLRRRLMQIDGENPDAEVGRPSPVYDDALEKRLKAFQRAHDLDADGMAGPRTQMMLNGAVASPGAPSLHAVSS